MEVVRQTSPEMVMESIDDESLPLGGIRRRTIFLNFWATCCRPCVAGIPDLVCLPEEVDTNDLLVIGIRNESASKLERFV